MMSKIQIYSDGGARGNPGPAGIGVLICASNGMTIREHKEIIGETTNNVAEYTAVIVALELARQLGAKEIDFYVDSQLVANQLLGKFKIKTPHIQTLVDKVREKLSVFEQVSFQHVPRTHEMIKRADKLVNQALDEAES